MSKINLSPIQIHSIELTEASFRVNRTPVANTVIESENLAIDVTLEQKSNVAISTSAFIQVKEAEGFPLDYEARLSFRIEARISDEQFAEKLKEFAKFGAPFNAMVHARDLLSSLSTRAFGKSVLIPLLDVRELGQQINIIDSSLNSETSNTPDNTVLGSDEK